MPKARVTITLDPAVWRRTKRIARERKTSASALVQEVLQALPDSDVAERLAAVEYIASMSLPIGTPEELAETFADAHAPCLG